MSCESCPAVKFCDSQAREYELRAKKTAYELALANLSSLRAGGNVLNVLAAVLRTSAGTEAPDAEPVEVEAVLADTEAAIDYQLEVAMPARRELEARSLSEMGTADAASSLGVDLVADCHPGLGHGLVSLAQQAGAFICSSNHPLKGQVLSYAQHGDTGFAEMLEYNYRQSEQ